MFASLVSFFVYSDKGHAPSMESTYDSSLRLYVTPYSIELRHACALRDTIESLSSMVGACGQRGHITQAVFADFYYSLSLRSAAGAFRVLGDGRHGEVHLLDRTATSCREFIQGGDFSLVLLQSGFSLSFQRTCRLHDSS